MGVPENYEESNPLNYGLRQVFPPHRWVAWSWLRRNLGQRVLMEVQKKSEENDRVRVVAVSAVSGYFGGFQSNKSVHVHDVHPNCQEK